MSLLELSAVAFRMPLLSKRSVPSAPLKYRQVREVPLCGLHTGPWACLCAVSLGCSDTFLLSLRDSRGPTAGSVFSQQKFLVNIFSNSHSFTVFKPLNVVNILILQCIPVELCSFISNFLIKINNQIIRTVKMLCSPASLSPHKHNN